MITGLLGSRLEAGTFTSVLQDGVKSIDIQSGVTFLRDPASNFELADLHRAEALGEWRVVPPGVPSLGFTTDRIWLHFRVDNRSPSTSWQLLVDYALLTSLTLYEVQDGRVLAKAVTGMGTSYQDRVADYRSYVLPLALTKTGVVDYYLGLESYIAVQAPLQIWEEKALESRTSRISFLQGIYFGVMFLIMIYNFFIFLATREKTFLFYVSFAASVTMFLLATTGFGYQIIWSESGYIQRRITVFAISSCVATGVLFTNDFLALREHQPRMGRFLVLQGWLAGILMVAAAVAADDPANVVIPAILVSVLACSCAVYCGVMRVLEGDVLARFYIVAWGSFLVGSIMRALNKFAVLPFNEITENGQQVGSLLEVLLLSFAIGYRINLERKEKFVAQKRALESEMARTEEQRRLNRLKDDFLANTSHELRTPLNGIVGISDSLLEGAGGQLPLDALRNIRMISDSGRRLTHLVNDLLDLSRLKHREITLRLAAVSLNPIVDLVIILVKAKADEKKVKLINELSDDMPLLIADGDRLCQILLNLVGNAVKFTGAGTVTISAELTDNCVEIRVTDTGIGIAAKDQALIFNEFEQADGSIARNYGGTGLGLSISKKLVELHGGTIGCRSELGKGSQFYFTMTKAANSAVSAGGQSTPAYLSGISHATLVAQGEVESIPLADPAQSGAGESFQSPSNMSSVGSPRWRILAVDDEPVNLQVIENFMRLADFDVVCVGDPFEALNIVRSGETFDAVVLDLMMPKMSGFELCRHIREIYPSNELPILFLTAKNQVEDLAAGFEHGGNDYLVKPLHRGELIARLRAHISLKSLVKQVSLMRENRVRVEEAIAAARVVQKTLFPEEILFPNLATSVSFSPAEGIGGDWYSSYFDEENRIGYVFLGDVNGHGIASALLTGVACGAVSSVMRLAPDELRVNPHAMLKNVIQIVDRVLLESSARSGLGMTMVCLAVAVDSGECTILHCAHPGAFLVSGNSSTMLTARGMLLGSGEEFVCQERMFRLSEGDRLLLYSDGLFDNGAEGKHPLRKRTLAKLLEANPGSPEETLKEIRKACESGWVDKKGRDDCTMLMLQFGGESSFTQVGAMDDHDSDAA